ncbi:PREDICTED: UPF0472 protein C16orf72 homolog [Chrysochloris asiatica]|uniref:UPF0472 protein C16orf72 homolog n=1 Tax=Chrysochloris asiatica TaxID=185453 RepID=A0A9B0TTD3_CHRAS|nr:PREDICTED: UPF0472 protein C16orf72 homolog [Chrysochloris asiatica]
MWAGEGGDQQPQRRRRQRRRRRSSVFGVGSAAQAELRERLGGEEPPVTKWRREAAPLCPGARLGAGIQAERLLVPQHGPRALPGAPLAARSALRPRPRPTNTPLSGFCVFLSADRVCQQPGLSLWVPFQNAATAVTNLYKESVDTHQRSFDIGIQIGYQRRNKDVLAWVKKRRRTIRREDLISFLCGKVPPPRNSRAPPRLTVVSPNRATPTETSSSVETDLQPFREAIALHGLSGAMASISVRSSTPGSPTHVSSGSNTSRRRNGLHDVDLNTFISEEMALHLDNGGTRKRTSAQCGDVITDSPTHKRNRII